MSSSSPSTVPPGWYPDPAGNRQWRVWTGAQWSELTRPYGPAVEVASALDHLTLVQALRRLMRYGIGSVYAGLAVVVGVYAHWPGTAHPTSRIFAVTASDVAFALIAIGTACFAFAAHELEGRWSLWQVLPGINLMGVNALVSNRLGAGGLRRAASESVLLILYVAQFHAQPWLCVAPMVLAMGHATGTSSLIEQLVGSTSLGHPSAP